MNNHNIVRLFTGTFLNSEIFNESYKMLSDEIRSYFKGKAVEPENTHFTWQFIGDFPTNQVTTLKNKLLPVIREYNESLSLAGLDGFPSRQKPRVLVIPVISNPNVLDSIWNESNAILKPFGYKPDRKFFTPHVTLMRIKEIQTARTDGLFEKYRDIKFGTTDKFEYNLIASELTVKGPIYRIV